MKKLRSGQSDYFHCKANNDDELIDKIKGELIRIKNEYEAKKKSSIGSVENTLSRLRFDSILTKEAIKLFEIGNYSEAAKALDMNKIREQAEKLSAAPKDVAEAFVLKAKLELTDVKNKERFTVAKKLFNEALNASHDPEILFEYAYHCAEQKEFKEAIELYNETLRLYRKLAADNPSAYTAAVAATMNNLATLHRINNAYPQAELEYGEALALITPFYQKYPQAFQIRYDLIKRNLSLLLDQKNGGK